MMWWGEALVRGPPAAPGHGWAHRPPAHRGEYSDKPIAVMATPLRANLPTVGAHSPLAPAC